MIIQTCKNVELLRKMYLSTEIQMKRILEEGKKDTEVDVDELILEQLRIKLRLEELADGVDE